MNKAADLPECCKQDLELNRELTRHDRKILRFMQGLVAAMVCALLLMVAGGIYTIQAMREAHDKNLAIARAYHQQQKQKVKKELWLLTLSNHGQDTIRMVFDPR